MTNLSDTLLVSISFSDKDTGVLVVGRKRKNQSRWWRQHCVYQSIYGLRSVSSYPRQDCDLDEIWNCQ
jgi:hypothetical protein